MPVVQDSRQLPRFDAPTNTRLSLSRARAEARREVRNGPAEGVGGSLGRRRSLG